MSLFDSNFLRLDGTPVIGRIPVRLVVEGGGSLNFRQMAELEQVYTQFRAGVRLSVADFHTEQVRLSDGSMVDIHSLQDRDTVTVKPENDGQEVVALPHGFAVVTNWQNPTIYRRDINGPVIPLWVFAPDDVVQVTTGTGIYDNQAFRAAFPAMSPAQYFTLPMVYHRGEPILWDYNLRGALASASTNPPVPFILKDTTTGAFPFEAPTYAVENKVLLDSGTVLYTMANATGILAPAADGYPELVRHLAPVTDAEGNQAALQQWRYAVISPTFNIWKFRLCNERIRRIADVNTLVDLEWVMLPTFEAIERNVQDITTPWPKQTVGATSVIDSALGEDPDDLLYAVTMALQTVDGVDPVGGGGWLPDIAQTGSWVTGWYDALLDISGVTRRSSYVDAMREITTQAAGAATLLKVAAVGLHTTVGYIDIKNETNYPADILWRGGEAGIGYWTSDIFGSSFSGDGYGTSNAVIKRKDTKYNVDGNPKVTAVLGWKDLLLLEGTTTGRMSGRVYENVETIYGKFTNYSYRNFITRETYQVTNPAGAGYVSSSLLGTWLTAHNIRDTYYEALRLEHGTGASGPNSTTKNTTVENLRPTNTVAYSLKSRYVIDYDHKGRFYAAIRCEVECSGAEWEENTAVYEGFMQVKTDPSYTVRIYFESEWNGVFAQQLLVEESITRPGFEIITIEKFSPWYWPFPAYIDRSCKARVPPEPVPDERFMMQLANLSNHQGVNTNLCCADVRPDITGGEVAKTQSQDGIEYSYATGAEVIPHEKYVTGQLYARTFKLSDIADSLWLLYQLKCDAIEDNFQPADPAPIRPAWYYHPAIKAALEVTRHIEVRDGIIVQWSDGLEGLVSGYPPAAAAPPAATARDIKLYRV